MSTGKLQSIAIYVAIGVCILLAGALGQAVGDGSLPGFRDGETFAGVRGQVGDLLSLLVTAGGLWIAAHRPRFGSEKLAEQVKSLQAEGVSRDDMAVLTKTEAEVLRAEVARLQRVKPLRDMAAADEALSPRTGRG